MSERYQFGLIITIYSCCFRLVTDFFLHCSLQPAENMRRSSIDPEKEWMDKVFDECMDEFSESFGVYDGKAKPLTP